VNGPPEFDVVIVGSGATGGWAAMKLTQAGLRVCLLEAGPPIDPAKDFNAWLPPQAVELRHHVKPRALMERQPIQGRNTAHDELSARFFIDDREHPYSTPPERPFLWSRNRCVGGRTNTWGRTCLRMGEQDFRAASLDGVGIDWPLSYAELAPYYDEVEEHIGVAGEAAGLAQLPDGKFLPPLPLSAGEEHFRRVVSQKLGRVVTPNRKANLTRPWKGRGRCQLRGRCARGCPARAYFSSSNSTLPVAEATGRLTLMTDSVVSHVTTDDEGRARGVWCVDRLTRQQREVRGRVIVLCAGELESTRILLNSISSRYPAGLGNSSGVLGRYFTTHPVAALAVGVLPQVRGREPAPSSHPSLALVPRFRNLGTSKPSSGFLRGYNIFVESQPMGWAQGFALGGFGADLKRRIERTPCPWYISANIIGECLPYWENHVRLDADLKDAWGIPALHIDISYGANEAAMVQDASAAAAEMLEAAGARELSILPAVADRSRGVLEAGTARMGADPRNSVLNGWCQSHDVKNLFVLDGAALPSGPCQNITLTMMALAARSASYIARELKALNL